MNAKHVCLIACVIGVWSASFALASDVEHVVSSFYPQHLIDLRHRDRSTDLPDVKEQVWAALNEEGDLIVAAYSNDSYGAIRVIRVSGHEGILLWASTEVLGGSEPEITLMDFDGDGQKDFLVSFSTGQGRYHTSWAYLWNGHKGGAVSPPDGFTSPDFVDVDSDGVLEVVDGFEDPEGDVQLDLYRLGDHGYVRSEPVVSIWTCGRGEQGKPLEQGTDFYSDRASAVLLVMNGAEESPRAASLKIDLNGQSLVTQSQVNETVGEVSVPVSLRTGDASNHLTCTVFGKPGAFVKLMIYRPVPVE